MKNNILVGFLSLALCGAAFTGCSNDDIQETVNQEPVKPTVAPLTVTVEAQKSRIAIGDNNGSDQKDGFTSLSSIKWEDGDYIWAYSPSYKNSNGTYGGYTKLKVNTNTISSNQASFSAVGESKYVEGKPLYIYYHGGSMESSMSSNEDSTIAVFERAADDGNHFVFGKDTKKSTQNDPYFVYSGYVASAPSDGNISCTLQSRMSMLSFRIPWTKGLVGSLGTGLGTAKYEIVISCKREDTGKSGFPAKVALKHDSNGKLTETVESWGDPLTYEIHQAGLTNPTGELLLAGNGMVYVSIPAVKYTNLRVSVKITQISSKQGLLSVLLPGLDIENQGFTYPAVKDNGTSETVAKGISFTIDPNNGGINNANTVYGMGNVFKMTDSQISTLPLFAQALLAPLSWLGGIVGVYEGAGNGWSTVNWGLISL